MSLTSNCTIQTNVALTVYFSQFIQDVLDKGLKVLVMTGSSDASRILNAPKDTSMGQICKEAIDTYDEIVEEMTRNPKSVIYMTYFYV